MCPHARNCHLALAKRLNSVTVAEVQESEESGLLHKTGGTGMAQPRQGTAEAEGQKAALGEPSPTVSKRTGGGQDLSHLGCLRRSGPQTSSSIQRRGYRVGRITP